MDGLIAAFTEYASSSQLIVSVSLTSFHAYAPVTQVSALCLVTYDHFLTFEKERKFIWGTMCTPGTVLFIAIRYLPFIDLSFLIYNQSNLNVQEGTCPAVISWYQFSSVSSIIAVVLTDWVIGLRTWAIWGRSNICAALVAAAWIGATAGSLYFQVTALQGVPLVPAPPGSGLPGCILYSDPDTLTKIFTIYAVYETGQSQHTSVSVSPIPLANSFTALIFTATLVRGVGHLRYTPAKLMSVLYRDAFITSATLFLLAILILVTLKVSSNWSFGLTSLYRAMNAILPERIILNLRETATGGTINGWDVMTEDPALQQDSSGSGSTDHNKRYGGRNRGGPTRAGEAYQPPRAGLLRQSVTEKSAAQAVLAARLGVDQLDEIFGNIW
ncbi:hypothetical protein CALVIDRAFT_594768 [Calocera viscosa TUFC12733]|uniref:DUF6533 domain-containing protein n=1 Tax=Calocera viscosa (strain TUFC12733) TaxID=1330018 RepID=A0A167RTP6_CALVF|nr:hypothetical protein CALVIDRAFT_594768 [Calocera viscosa TUFC12733]